jgi:hypothetical protein
MGVYMQSCRWGDKNCAIFRLIGCLTILSFIFILAKEVPKEVIASSLHLSMSSINLVPQGTAYSLLIGLGVRFCGVILGAVKIQKLYLEEDSWKLEMFMAGNRTVGTGLTAAAVCSSRM